MKLYFSPKGLAAFASSFSLIAGVVVIMSASELVAQTPTSGSSLVVNGSFESPAGVSSYQVFGAGLSLSGWVVESGTVEIVAGTYWQTAEGAQSLDLNGIFDQIGTIYQDLPTVPGQTYQLRFAYAGNPEGLVPAIKSANVFWDGSQVTSLSFDVTGHSRSNLGWIYYEATVIASSSTTRLRFQSTSPTFCGLTLDDITVTPVGTNTLVPPFITKQPASKTIISGGDAMFSVTAVGTAPLRYQWYFNTGALAGQTNNTLTLNNVQTNRAGNYYVVITNVAGSVTSAIATLTVPTTIGTAANGLLAYWKLDEGADQVRHDSVSGLDLSENSYYSWEQSSVSIGQTTGVASNAAVIVDGRNWGLFRSDVPDFGTEDFTVACWFKFRSGRYDNQALFYCGRFAIGIRPFEHRVGFTCYTDNQAGASAVQSPYNSISEGVWTHCVAVKSGSTLKLYLNGVDCGNLGTLTGTSVVHPVNGLRLGLFDSGYPLNGALDEVAVWHKALTANEVAEVYASPSIDSAFLPPTITSVSPASWYVNEGDSVSFTATATGSRTLTYQWRHEGLDISGGTNANLILTNVEYAQAGNYSVVVSNTFGSTISSNVPLRVNRVPIADASATMLINISSNGTNAVVALDGSRSYDPDGDDLTYVWFHQNDTNPCATGVVAIQPLLLGTNYLTLVVNDGMASNFQSFMVEVITTSQAIDRLIELVQTDSSHVQPLVTSLRAALASIDRSQPATAINQLEAFINKVQSQLAPANPTLAAQLIAEAQAIIDALNGGTSPAVANVTITSIQRGHGKKPHLEIRGINGRVHVIETSTNLVDWVPIGVATQTGDNMYEFDDSNTAETGAQYYRVVLQH
jgi:choice-of-anchor C domain-containing protein